MAAKLSTLAIPKKIPRWVCLNSYISSLSHANIIQTTPETHKDPTFTSDLEAKIESLNNKLDPNTLNSVLDSTHDVNSSLKLFKWASTKKRFKHSSDTYRRIILKLGMSGNIEEMEGYCNEMVKENCLGFGDALLGLLDSFVRNGRLDEALRVVFVLNSTRFKPSIHVFNELMGEIVGKRRDFKDVLFVYKEMVKAGIVPNVDTVNFMLEALFESGRVDTALDHYKRMCRKGCDPNSKTFEVVVSGLVACLRVDEALRVIDEMISLGEKLDLDSKFYTCVIPLFCGMNNLEVAMKLFRMMRDSRISPDLLTYRMVIHSSCKNLEVYEAVKIFDEMIDGGLEPDDEALVDITHGFCELNKLDEANKFLEDREIVRTCTHNVLLGAYCGAGEILVAKALFGKMLEVGVMDIVSWNTMIGYFCENVGMNKAVEYLCKMIVSSFSPDSTTYSSLIVGKCRSGESKGAFVLFLHVLAKSWVLDYVAYAELVASLCQRGKIQEAVKVFRYSSRNRFSPRPSSFDMLIEGVCETEGVGSAVELLRLGSFAGTRGLHASYQCIIRRLAESGNRNDLFVILARMLVNGCPLDREAYSFLLQSMISIGHARESSILFNLMLDEGSLPDSETLANLLSSVAGASQLHEHLSALDQKVSECRILEPATYTVLINGLWREGYRRRACELLDKMLEDGWVPDASTHALLMGRDTGERTAGGESDVKGFVLPDNVSIILAEGLGYT